jgi:hypothetical protein
MSKPYPSIEDYGGQKRMLQLATATEVPVSDRAAYEEKITPIITAAMEAWGCMACDVMFDNMEGCLCQCVIYCCPKHQRYMVIVSVRDSETGVSIAFLTSGGVTGPDPT